MGPTYLLDIVDTDIVHHAQVVMTAGFPQWTQRDHHDAIDALSDANRFGQRNGLGFWCYKEDSRNKPKKEEDTAVEDLLAEMGQSKCDFSKEGAIARMVIPMVNEVVRCLEEGIIATPAEADMALAHDLGFPSFHGGAFRWLDTLGSAKHLDIAQQYQHLGPLCEVPEGLRNKARHNEPYHPLVEPARPVDDLKTAQEVAMEQVVIVDVVRIPVGRSKDGASHNMHAEDLSAYLIRNLLARNPAPEVVTLDDTYWGCVQQTLEQDFSVARNTTLLTEAPHSVPAVTVNRLCGSSMQALHGVARMIMAGDAQACLVGGVEYMGHAPMSHGADFHPGLSRNVAKAAGVVGLTVETLTRMHSINHEVQDTFAVRSHTRVWAVTQSAVFKNEIIPTGGYDADDVLKQFNYNEVIHPETAVETLATLRLAFDPVDGTVTVDTPSALPDGAVAILTMNKSRAHELDLKPHVCMRPMTVVGCNPSITGYGPVPASKLALKKAEFSASDIGVFEMSEALVAQILSCIRDLGLIERVDEKIDLSDGTIAPDHPLGCSNARTNTILLNLMERKDVQSGLVTICVGLGQDIATVFEQV